MEINEFAAMNYKRSKDNEPHKDGRFNLEYFLIAMAGECGEALNILKKVKRGDFGLSTAHAEDKIIEEVVDVITYGFLAMSEAGFNVEKTIMQKYERVNRRIAAGGFAKRDTD